MPELEPQASTAASTTTAQPSEPAPQAAVEAVAETPAPFIPANADEILFGEPAPEEAASEVAPVVTEPEPAPESTPATEPPASDPSPAVEVEAPVVEPAEAPAEKVLPSRISTSQFSAEEKEIIALSKELRDQGVPDALMAATKFIENRRQQAQAAEDASREHEAANDPILKLEQEVEELKSRIILAGQRNELPSEESEADRLDYMDKLSDLKLARKERSEARASEAAIKATGEYNTVRTQIISEYPDFDKEGSALRRLANKEGEAMNSPHHPNHKLLGTPAALTAIADAVFADVAAVRGITPEQARASFKAKAPAAPAAFAAPEPVAPVTPAPAGPRPASEKNLSVAPGGSAPVTPAATPNLADLLAQSLRPGFDHDSALNLTYSGLKVS